MGSEEVKYYIENDVKIKFELEKVLTLLPPLVIKRLENYIKDGDYKKGFNYLHTYINNHLTTYNKLLPFFKLFFFFNNPELKDKLFSKLEYENIIKSVIDYWGNNIIHLIDVKKLDISSLNFLLDIDKKYYDTYKLIVKIQLLSKSDLDAIKVITGLPDIMFQEKFILKIVFNKIDSLSDINSIMKLIQLLPKEILLNSDILRKVVIKTPEILKRFPLESFKTDISQMEYDKLYEDLVLYVIDNIEDINLLNNIIPSEVINERIWNKLVDKGIKNLELLSKCFSLKKLRLENITLQMAKRSIELFGYNELEFIPDIDQNVNELFGKKKEQYKRWLSSFNDKEKELYSNWYNKTIRLAVIKDYKNLDYINPSNKNYKELINIAFKDKLLEMGRINLTDDELDLIQKFAYANADLFKTLQLEMLDPKIVNVIGVNSLEKIVRYVGVQKNILNIAKDNSALITLDFALKNLKRDIIFIEPLIEKLSISILNIINENRLFLDLVAEKDLNDLSLYEKAIISYLTLNFKEAKQIKSYDDILTYVIRKNYELESIVSNRNSTLNEVKNAYLERLIGLSYDEVKDLVDMFGNDPEELLENYNDVNPDSYQELAEKEALEIIIKLKSLIYTEDINAIKQAFLKATSMENSDESFVRYEKSSILETTLRRAYGRELVSSINNTGLNSVQELEFEGKKYYVRKLNGKFNRLVSLLDAYRESNLDINMYDKWNTRKMTDNHALCFSLINQSNPGTAKIDGNDGIMISIGDFSPDSLTAAAPYDLYSDSRENTITTKFKQKYYTTKNMPNKTRTFYSEYDVEIQDVLNKSNIFSKIQPTSIICFETIDDDSIRASIDLSERLGQPVIIELIDRKQLALNEMVHIEQILHKFKTNKKIDVSLVLDINTIFKNVLNANVSSDISEEIIGPGKMFDIENLNKLLEECLKFIEQKMLQGQIKKGLEALMILKEELENEFGSEDIIIKIDQLINKSKLMSVNYYIDSAVDESKVGKRI